VRPPRDQRPYNVAYYRAHRREEIERVLSRQRLTLEFLRDLRRRPCADCGETFSPHVMDFDHRDPLKKSFNITSSRAMLMSRPRLLAEIEKCDIVCANCHAIRTYRWLQENKDSLTWWSRGTSSRIEEKRAYWRSHAELLARLRDVPCLDCGRRFPFYVMQFDHRDPVKKRYTRLANDQQSWYETHPRRSGKVRYRLC
jgi:hypothetical protein